MSNRPVIIASGVSSTMPLMKPLAEDFDLAIVHGEAAQQFQLMELPIVSLQSMITQETASEALTGATVQASKIVNGLKQGKIKRQFKRILPNVEVDDWLPGWAHDSLRRQIAMIGILDRLIEQADVVATVLHEDTTEAFATVACWSRARQIPCFHVPHAVYHRPANYGGPGTDIHDIVVASHVAASGFYQGDWYDERGAENLNVTGAPRWDEWATMKVDKNWARVALKIDHRETWCYLSAWVQATSAFNYPQTMWNVYELVLKAAKASGAQLVVKTHPSAGPDDENVHAQIATEHEVDCVVSRQYLDICLQAADVAISYGPSNALVEAALINVPGTTLHFAGAFDGSGYVTHADNTVDSLLDAIRADRSGRDELIEKMAYKADGQSTQRVIDWIKEVANRD